MARAAPLGDLSNDELGHAAEAAFGLLCAQAQLTANKSDRDRTGWDFIVEFPLPDPNPRLPLDLREPTSCRVQLKASVGSDRVSLKLSAAERLAKAAGPSMVIVFRMSPSGRVLAGFVIAMLDENLAKVLRRLRQAQLERRDDLHRMSITYDARRAGKWFEPTAESLRHALSAACGADPAAYLAEKHRQLAELGYEDGRYQIDAAFAADNAEDLMDVFLGLKPVTPTKFEAFDARFGLRLPLDPPAAHRNIELRVLPEPAGHCTVQVRGRGLAPPAVFSAEVLVAPPISGGFKMAFRHPDLLVTFSDRELHVETPRPISEDQRTLAGWLNLFRALQAMGTGEGVLAFSGWRFSGPVEFKVSAPLTGPYIEDMPCFIELTESAQRLLVLAGAPADPSLSFAELRSASHDIRLAADMLLNPTPTAVFSFEVEEGDVDDELTYLHAGRWAVGAAEFAYAVRLTFRRTENTDDYSSVAIEPLDVRPIAGAELARYAHDQAEKQALPCLLDYLPAPSAAPDEGFSRPAAAP